MYRYIRVRNHKGIRDVSLSSLGQLNIICGKNNSGKTSILEAIMEPGCRLLGREIISDIEWIKDLYKSKADGYSSPSPVVTIPKFNQFLDSLAAKGEILYKDKVTQLIEELNKQSRDAAGLVGNLFERFLDKPLEKFNPLLVPAKRTIESIVPIQIDENVEPDGSGITNMLFNLKNQDIESSSYRAYMKILDSFKEITGHIFKIITTSSNKIEISFKNDNSDWALADSCGMGLSDVLVIICHSLDTEHNFILIEEPESHLHPEMQKKLLSFLKKIKSKQFILSTHSSIFLNPYVADKIFFSQITDQVKLSDETHRSEILQSLGYSVTENIVSDVVVLTEGPTDIPILTRLLQLNGVFDKYNIKFWPLGGDIMAQLDLDVFAERKNVIAIVDSDPKSGKIRTRFVRQCKEKGITCIRLKRYAIENYFSIDALRKVLQDNFPKHLTEIDPNRKLDDQLGNSNNEKLKRPSIKTKNLEIVSHMTLEDFKGSDLQTFVKELIKICEVSRSNDNPKV
ncbi:ATP-dependent nuclease [Paenibacillus chitinolyticus]|uniref:ATP-dependent nuclease n=1 Tax=Paenibacillus chitinolyticus TaxID=79263 RepID=UPI003671A072